MKWEIAIEIEVSCEDKSVIKDRFEKLVLKHLENTQFMTGKPEDLVNLTVTNLEG